MAQQPNPAYYNIKDDQDHDYYFDPCSPITAAVSDGSAMNAHACIRDYAWAGHSNLTGM